MQKDCALRVPSLTPELVPYVRGALNSKADDVSASSVINV
jgi:hypothetical protein